MSNNFNKRIEAMRRELQALKVNKLRSASVLKTDTKSISLSFTCAPYEQWGDIYARQAAYITATATNTELADITLGGAWDGRMYETARKVVDDKKITWVVAPVVFLESDYNQTSDFILKITMNIITSSDAVLSISYGENPYTRAF